WDSPSSRRLGSPTKRTIPVKILRRATELHAHGTDDKDIQRVMRHSELRTTQTIYIKADEEKAREGINKLEESFRSRKVVSYKKTAQAFSSRLSHQTLGRFHVVFRRLKVRVKLV